MAGAYYGAVRSGRLGSSPMRLITGPRELYTRLGLRELLPMPAKLALRRVWARAAFRIGHPVGSPLFPHPRLDRGRRPLRLARVLLASDRNPRYLGCWPLARRAWREILGIDAVLV